MSLQILNWDDNFQGSPLPESAVTIGVFDGVHLGHRELINRIVSKGPNPTVVTFRENPKKMLSHRPYGGDIYSLKQKLNIFEGLGVSKVILIDFSENFSKLNGREFFKRLEDRIKVVFLAVGSNFRCGYRQDTGVDYIRELYERRGIPTEVLSPVDIPNSPGAEPVNSSRIRAAILRGDIKQAAVLMGRNAELDLSDLESADSPSVETEPVSCKPMHPKQADDVSVMERHGIFFDLRSRNRIIPKAGQYQVIVHPGGEAGMVIINGGKVYLYRDGLNGRGAISKIDSVEFI